ncbi:hypothetical protein CapIbe_014316 [Capra ibex]
MSLMSPTLAGSSFCGDRRPLKKMSWQQGPHTHSPNRPQEWQASSLSEALTPPSHLIKTNLSCVLSSPSSLLNLFEQNHRRLLEKVQ